MSWVIDSQVATYIALVASTLTIIMWLAPVRDVWTAPYSIFRAGNTENVATGFGFVAGTFNCILWNLYAYNKLDIMFVPFVVNTAGFFLNISFVLCYFCYGDSKARRETRNHLLAMLFVTAVAAGSWWAEGNNEPVGYFASFVNVLMLFGPLAAARDVIRSRSARGLSLLPLVMTLVASLVWCSYGVYIQNIPAIVPNGLGILFGILQLVLFAWAKNQEKKGLGGIGDEEEALPNDGFEPVVTPTRPSWDSRDPEEAGSLTGGVPRPRGSSIRAVIEGIP
jgi:solute carrier family 50 protein (sugar transporter)